MSDDLKPLIGLAADRPLTRDEAERAFGALFEGTATPSQLGGFLMALRTRGETVEEIAAAARVMRAKCNAVRAPEGAIDPAFVGRLGPDISFFGFELPAGLDPSLVIVARIRRGGCNDTDPVIYEARPEDPSRPTLLPPIRCVRR